MVDQSLTCAQLAAARGYLNQSLSNLTEDRSGYVLVDVHFTHDGVSIRPNCDGPIIWLRLRNTSSQTVWALLPHKKKGSPWFQIDPNTDQVIDTQTGSQAQRNAAIKFLSDNGVVNFSDADAVEYVYSQPA